MSDSLGPRPPTFMPGYDTSRGKSQYMNVGLVESPYPGKKGQGDWGPLQGGGVYYQPYNPTYPYPMNFSSEIPISQWPMLTYDQDIPLFIRKQDMKLHGVASVPPVHHNILPPSFNRGSCTPSYQQPKY